MKFTPPKRPKVMRGPEAFSRGYALMQDRAEDGAAYREYLKLRGEKSPAEGAPRKSRRK